MCDRGSRAGDVASATTRLAAARAFDGTDLARDALFHRCRPFAEVLDAFERTSGWSVAVPQAG